MLFLQVLAALQFNLHLTEWNNTDENDIIVQHDCLRIDVWENIDNYEIISYCMSNWSSEWNIETDNSKRRFTFAELSKRNITSQQLYQWLAPMDLIEDYQYYLNQLLISNETSMSTYAYYNYTLPNFGLRCEYSFDEYNPFYLSLRQLIYEFYNTIEYKLNNEACYTHLECDLGFMSLCIGWTNICDGVVQCINGIDEEHCWQLEVNECKEDEFRCNNG